MAYGKPMKKTSPSLIGVCALRQRKKWWVDSINDTENWDIDDLGIIDPKQFLYISELLDSMTEFGLQSQMVDEAFFTFEISEELKDEKVKLVRSERLTFESRRYAICTSRCARRGERTIRRFP